MTDESGENKDRIKRTRTGHDLLLRELVRSVQAQGLEAEEADILRYIEYRWIIPEQASPLRFAAVDVSRACLIRELEIQFSLNEEGVDVALMLIDRIFALRRDLLSIEEVIAHIPPEHRARIKAILGKS